MKSLEGGVCTCQEGYTIYANDSRSCVDRNECEEWGFCSQECENNKGSYKCSCVKGYKLDKAGKRCVAEEPAKIYFIHHTNLYRMSGEDGGHVQVGFNFCIHSCF